MTPPNDQARTVFYGGIDRRPAVIVRPTDASDVAQVVSIARDSGLELAPQQRTAWAETGLTAGEYTTAAGAYGLATGFGDTGSVGIGGITLGGGIGYLVRKHGLTIDDLVAAELVGADGQLLHLDDQSHPDLFWAIRGGGGNFGVATRFQYRLHPLDQIVGGLLLQPRPEGSFPTPMIRAIDQVEADAELGAGVKRARWSCARELISSLR